MEGVSSSPNMDCIVGVSRNRNIYRMSLLSALSRGHSCSPAPPPARAYGRRCGNGRFATLYQFLYIYSIDAYCTFLYCCVHTQYGTGDAEL